MADLQASDLEARAINVIRGLSMDAPHAASSGHQGTAMALAPAAHVLFTRIMNYDASDTTWFDRDRFVLSVGHASILHYALLHLTGCGLTLDDLKAFRQWDSLTPGHPEVGHTAGIEVTTGPLGQGIANAVGMAMAERRLRERLGAEVCDHFTYVICGDGDLSEGVSHEAASLAGHQGLGRLIAIYDDNHVSIDGPTELALSDEAPRRFAAYGWHVIDLGESAEDLDAIENAINNAKAVEDQPTLIVIRSHIGFPSPDHTDDPHAHGYVFKDDEIAATKAVMGLPNEPFHVPDDVLDYYREAGARGAQRHTDWTQRYENYGGDRDVLRAMLDGTGMENWQQGLPTAEVGQQVATRKTSGVCLNAVAEGVPSLVAGSADLTSNTGTKLDAATAMSAAEPAGRQIYFGIREHAMGSIMNGMALHGGVLPVGGTFLVFSDYMRPAVRLAALQQAKVIYSWTHDSVGVGEDGPTHQPVEHVMSLRAIPGLRVIRPADANETAAAWKVAVGSDGPTALILSRQNLPVLAGTDHDGVQRGAYTLVDANDPQLVLIGTGSEVHLCVEAAQQLTAAGTPTRVVSMPSWDLFAAQDAAYRASVLGTGIPAVSVEAGVTLGWERWADVPVGIDRFGASAPGGEALDKLGMNVANIVEHAHALLGSD